MRSFSLPLRTPRVTARTRIFIAACIWSGVGALLFTKGLLLQKKLPLVWCVSIFFAAVLLGLVKSRYIFDRSAQKIIARTRSKPQLFCVGGVFSPQNWGLILGMILLGRILIWISAPTSLVMGLYFAVGSGLSFSSRIFWQSWKTWPAPYTSA